MANELWVNHDMAKGLVDPVQLAGLTYTGSNNGDTIGVHILRNGAPSTELAGQTAIGYLIRPDQQTVVIPGAISGGDVSVTLPSEAYAYAGRCSLVIRVSNTSGNKVPIFHGYFNIGLTSTDETIDPGELIPSLEDLLAQIDAMEAATDEANELIDGFEDRISTAVVRSANLYNKATRNLGLQLYADGSEHSLDTYDTSDYIPVTPGVKYYAGYWVRETGAWQQIASDATETVITICAWYNTNKELITPTSTDLRKTGVTAPSGAAFMRFSINHGTYTDAAEYIVVATGGLPAEYVEYWALSKPLTLMQQQADFVTGRTVNLYNSAARLYNTNVSNSSGNIGRANSYDTSELIDLYGIPAGTYLKALFWNTETKSFGGKPFTNFAWYDETGAFLSGGNSGLSGSTGVAIPSGARYIRFQIAKAGNNGVSYAPLTTVLAPVSAFPSEYVGYFALTDEVGSKADVYRLDGSIEANGTISTWAELMTAAAAGGIYALASNIRYGAGGSDAAITFSKDFTLYGRGHMIHCNGSSNRLIVEAGSVNFIDCEIYNAGQYMVSATGGALAIRRCYMHVAGTAIRGTGTAIIHVDDTEIAIITGDDGFSLDQNARGYLNNCLIHGVKDEGVSTHGNSYCEVRNCEVYHCGFLIGAGGTVDTTKIGAASSWGGIHLGGGGMGKVIGCYSHHNAKYGIALYHFNGSNTDDSEECTGNTCEYNGFFINGSTLTRTVTAATPTVYDPETKIPDADIGSGGIMLCGCHDLDCSNNNVLNNAGYGIRAGLDGLYPNMGSQSMLCTGRIRHNYVSGNTSGANPVNDVNTPKIDDGCDGGVVITIPS